MIYIHLQVLSIESDEMNKVDTDVAKFFVTSATNL